MSTHAARALTELATSAAWRSYYPGSNVSCPGNRPDHRDGMCRRVITRVMAGAAAVYVRLTPDVDDHFTPLVHHRHHCRDCKYLIDVIVLSGYQAGLLSPNGSRP